MSFLFLYHRTTDIIQFVSVTWTAMIFNTRLVWNFLLSIFTFSVTAERLTMAGSNIDLITTPTEAGYKPRSTQGSTAHSYGSTATKVTSVEDTISFHYDVTMRRLNLKHTVQQASSATVGRETVVNADSSVTESPGVYTEIDVTTFADEVTKTLTQITIGNSRNATRHFSDNYSNTVSAYDFTTGSYIHDSDPRRFQVNDSRELGQTLNTKGHVMEAQPITVTVLPPLDVYWQQRLSKLLLAYISPFLIIIGTIGNSMSLIALQSRLFRFSSTGFILTALSTVDVAVLNTGLMRLWLLNAFEINIRNLSSFGCKLHFLLTYYLHQLASCTLLLLTIERTTSVWFPLRCKELCSMKRIVIAWLTIAFILFAEHTFFFPAFDLYPMTNVDLSYGNTTYVKYTCTIRADWYSFFDLEWSYIDACVGDFLPFLVVLIGNILTIVRILKSRWERERQMGAVPNSNAKLMASTTAMLIGVSVMFIVLSLPIDILFLYYAYRGSVLPQNEEQAIYNLAYAIVTLCYYSNNAFDFLMYLVSGRKFRQAFLETFLPCRKTAKPNPQPPMTNKRCGNQELANQPIALHADIEATYSSSC